MRSHTGHNLAQEVAGILHRHKLEDKVSFSYWKVPSHVLVLQWLGLAGDNASNNNTMTDHLLEIVPGWGGQHNRVCCICHILNLVEKVSGSGRHMETHSHVFLAGYSPSLNAQV